MPTLQEIKNRYGIIGNADELNRALDVALQIAPTNLSVLIVGESGVGKEAVPRLIHDNSSRKHNKYIAINCGSIPEGTIDSELFGHAKGSFTGAIGVREGFFGAANGGTIFLDEVGEMPKATQARLLRVLETGEYIRVGESEPRKTDVRIIAATNVNMQKAINEGRFREDLYYRLNTIPINLPPLRERGNDVEMIFRKFAKDTAMKYKREPIMLSDEARVVLRAYKWPGNIRQLKNIAEQLSFMCKDTIVTADDLYRAGVTIDSDTKELTTTRPSHLHSNSHTDYDYNLQITTLASALQQLNNEFQTFKKYVEQRLDGVNIKPKNEPLFIGGGENGSGSFTITKDNGNYNYPPETIQEDAPQTIEEIERIKIIESLKRHHNNRKKVAEELGLSERTLYRKLLKYDIKKE